MGIYQEKYTREYFTGVDKDGVSVGYGAVQETDSEGIWQLRSHDRKILDVIDFNGKQVLDIGFGRGEAICHAYLHGAIHCVGVDFSEAALILAKELIAKRHLPDAQLYHSDAYTFICEHAEKKIDIETKKFDIVLMLDFVEHIPRTELRKMLDCLKDIVTSNAILVLNTPEYKFDNDVIQNGYDERNMEDCYDTSDIVPETKGMHCNKYTVISLQNFMSECGFLNISEAHYYVNKSLFNEKVEKIKKISYSERWQNARELKAPLKTEYTDDIIEFPYRTIETPAYCKFDQGNMSGLTLLLTKTYQDIVFPGGNYDVEVFATIKQEDIKDKIIFEVGAFMGVNSLLFAKSSSPHGKVFAFEPNPWNRNRIFLNLSHNQNLAQRIQIYDYALGDINDISSMTISSDIDKGYSSTSRIDVSHPKIKNKDLPPGFFDVDVKIRTLDWFVESTGIIPDLIKIDIEGAEYSLLRGGLKTLQKNRPILFIELHSEFCALQCSLLLQDLDYQILLLKEEMDNRLMIKAVPVFHSIKKRLESNQNRYLDVISNQYEIVKQLQRFYNKELSDHHNLQTEHHALQTSHQALQAAYQGLHGELETLKSDYQSLQAERQGLHGEHETLKSDYQGLQAEHQGLHSELETLKLDYSDLQAEHQGLLGENEMLKSEYQSLQTEHQGLLGENETLKSEYHSLQTEHQGLLGEHEMVKSDYQILQVEHTELITELQDLQAELISLLSTKSVRFVKKLKAMFVKIGMRKTY